MKQLKGLKILPLVLMIGLGLFASNSSEAQKVEVTTSFLDTVGIELAKCTEANELLRIERDKTKGLQIDVDRKENVIVRQIEKNKVCYALRDSLILQVQNLSDIVYLQKSTIKKLGSKPKRFGLGPQIGFGYSFGQTVRSSITIGIGVQYNLLRF